MDGTTFFAEGLRNITFTLKPVTEGICGYHNRPATLYKFGNVMACRGCVLLRQTYPVHVKGNVLSKTRLGLGCYMLIAPSGTRYWGKHIMPDAIEVQPAAGAVRSLVRDLILQPPEPPWMFIAFARSNASDRLRVTTTNDLMQFAGKLSFPGTVDEPPVEWLNRKRIVALHEAADLTRDEWERCARSHAQLAFSIEALAYLRDLYQRYPKLAQYPIPPVRTPEYNAVRLLAREK